jgi:hypothetical protein
MRCPRCKLDNASGARYCNSCGFTLKTGDQAVSKKGSRFGIIFLVVLGACGFAILIVSTMSDQHVAPSLPSSSATPNASAATGNKAHDQLMLLPAGRRADMLASAVGEGCTGLQAFHMGMGKDGAAYWSVSCANGKSYEIEIQADSTGSTRVLNCDVLKAVAKVSCFKRFDSQ